MACSKQLPVSAITVSPKPINLLKAIARENCENELSGINFNKNGEKDGQGLVPIGECFIDTVIIKRLTSSLNSLNPLTMLYSEVKALLKQFNCNDCSSHHIGSHSNKKDSYVYM